MLWMAWDAKAKTLEPAITLVTGFQEADGSRWGRPIEGSGFPGALIRHVDAPGHGGPPATVG